MATPADADIILKLYDLRREETMRKARAFVAFHFNPKTSEELLVVQRGTGTEHNAFWRQVVSYWEMAASFCLRGAVDTDLFLDSSAEMFHIYAKFNELYIAATGQPFMPVTTKLIQTKRIAQDRYTAMLANLAKRKATADSSAANSMPADASAADATALPGN